MKTISAIAIIIAFSLNILSQDVSLKLSTGKGTGFFHPEKETQLLKLPARENISYDVKNLKGSLLRKNELRINTEQAPKKKKSMALGVVLSALLPGTGEFYGENYLKAGIFFGVEVLAWSYFIYFTKKGDNKTDEYQAYADKYWNVYTYAAWLKNEGFDGAGGIDLNANPDVLREQIMACERQNFSHTMPEYYSQQYYELIGKYQNFQAGWTNLEHVPTKAPGPYFYQDYKDPIFTNYSNERQKANDFYDYAKVGPITAILNHILSAADAAWTISTFNNRIKVETGFRIDTKRSPYTYEMEMLPTFNMSVSF